MHLGNNSRTTMTTITPTSCIDDFDCYNGGTCESPFDFMVDQDHIDATSTSECVCRPGYTGPKCEESCGIQCLNGGKCILSNDHGGLDIASDYVCDCPTGFSGPRCATGGQEKPTAPSNHVPNVLENQEESSNISDVPIGIVLGASLGGLFVGIMITLIAIRGCRGKITSRLPQTATATNAKDGSDDVRDVEARSYNEDGSANDSPMVDHDEEFVEPKTRIS